MCIGCVVGACTFLLTWGSGQVIAWRATKTREAAMARVNAADDGDLLPGAEAERPCRVLQVAAFPG